MASATATAPPIERVEAAHGGGGHATGGHSEHPAPSFGVDNRKLLMWMFLASDCMFFGSLIATYMIYRGRAEDIYHSFTTLPDGTQVRQGAGPLPSEILD